MPTFTLWTLSKHRNRNTSGRYDGLQQSQIKIVRTITDLVGRALRSTYDLVDGFGGALIVDPGKDSDRLKIGRLAEGDTFCWWADIGASAA